MNTRALWWALVRAVEWATSKKWHLSKPTFPGVLSAGLVILGALAAACGDQALGPAIGVVQVSVTTTGVELDTNGYSVAIDGGGGRAIPVNGTMAFTGLSAGSHNVLLAGLASNCGAVGAANPRPVEVVAGDTAKVAFSVACVATTGAVQVSVTTSGVELDTNGYSVAIDRGVWQAIPVNGTMTLSGLSAGSHSILLAGLTSNCAAGGGANPRPVAVVAGDTATVAFSVTCVATGSLAISIGTTGLDLDPNGYFIAPDGGPAQHSGIVDAVLFTGLSVGAHRVSVSGVATNCTVNPPSPITVTIFQSVSTHLAVVVVCVAAAGRADKFVFSADQGVRVGDLFVSQADGTSPSALGVVGFHPAWSPDASKIAFMCDRTIGADGLYRFNLCVMGASGDGLVHLTNDGSVTGRPTWAPDGLKLAFGRHEGLSIINSDGTGGRVVLDSATRGTNGSDAAWSPDGAAIALSCFNSGGGDDVCTVKPDGTGLAHLTNNLHNPSGLTTPAWSPDGSRIAFTSYEFRGPDFGGAYYGLGEVAVMNRDGSGIAQVTPGTWGGDPTWSPDGTRIAFSTLVFSNVGCPPDLDGCGDWHFEIALIRADGTQYQVLFDPSFGDTYSPTWMPR